MKVVIDILDNYYNTIKKNEYGIYKGRLYDIIRNGTPFTSRVMKEIKEIINCDADAEAKCRMIFDTITAKPYYFEEPQKSKEINMEDIETLIIEAANRLDLTYAKNFNGQAYALMNADWIGYFNTLDEVLEFLNISAEIDKAERRNI